ncbi:hypothetical protein Ancab_004885 [Ancistrocladus abbreviatus]
MGSRYGMGNRGSSRRLLKDEDFEEEDVWGVMENTEISNPKLRKLNESVSFCTSSSTSSWSLSSKPRMIPRASNPSKEVNQMVMAKQLSAPMNIPDTRKMHGMMVGSRKMTTTSRGEEGSWMVDHGRYGMNGVGNYYEGLDYDDDDGNNDDEEEIVPPHEYIARRLARSQISSFSVCEGIGRRLKGRDLSKVRNTILRKTGFLE